MVELLPAAPRLALLQAAPTRHPTATAQLQRQPLPGQSGLQHEQNPAQDRTVREAAAPPSGSRRRLRQHGGQDAPEFIRQDLFRPACFSSALLLIPTISVLLGALSVELDALPIDVLRARIIADVEARMDLAALQLVKTTEEAERERLVELLSEAY